MDDFDMYFLHPVGIVGMRRTYLNITKRGKFAAFFSGKANDEHAKGFGSFCSRQNVLRIAGSGDSQEDIALIAHAFYKPRKHLRISEIIRGTRQICRV